MSYLATEPEGFKLLSKFCVSAADQHPEFRTTAARHILRAMQVQAGLTLGLLAWDEGDRATAAARYQEALGLAKSVPAFRVPNHTAQHLDLAVQKDVLEMRRRLADMSPDEQPHKALRRRDMNSMKSMSGSSFLESGLDPSGTGGENIRVDKP